MTKKELYKAVKYQVEKYSADHGMNLAEMWEAVKKDPFWKQECESDYKER